MMPWHKSSRVVLLSYFPSKHTVPRNADEGWYWLECGALDSSFGFHQLSSRGQFSPI